MAQMRIAIVVPFLDEEAHLEGLLRSLASQTRRPDLLLLVDDGSRDGSVAIADAFAAEHGWARVVRRPPRPASRDRLAHGAAAEAFAWGVERLAGDWDVVAKLDADLQLTPLTAATVERALAEHPEIGIAGARLDVPAADGVPHRCPPGHVDGATKFYRRACWDEIAPFPVFLGWDTVDEIRARIRGWETRSVEVPGGNPVLLRPMGTYDGLLRAYRRWGRCAWGFGEHPLHVAAVAVQRAGDRPRVLGSLSYVLGWAAAGLARAPRAEAEVRRYIRRDQLQRLRRRVTGRPTRQTAAGSLR